MHTTSRPLYREQAAVALLALCLFLSSDARAAGQVTEVPEAVRKKFNLDTDFYKKHVDYKGILNPRLVQSL